MLKRGIFETVGGASVQRSAFNLSYEKKLTCKFGRLYPVLCEEAVPGDRWNIGNELVLRLQPMVAPVLHEINVYVHYFFVPYRLLWENWEQFITTPVGTPGAPVLPRWLPEAASATAPGTLWDYLGMPSIATDPEMPNQLTYHDNYPLTFPRTAYDLIWNEYYRDQNLFTAVVIDQNDYVSPAEDVPYNRAWEKDYFTSALPWQQKGTAPALPVTGHVAWDSDLFEIGSGDYDAAGSGTSGIGYVGFGTGLANDRLYANYSNVRSNANAFMNNNAFIGAGIDIKEIRVAFQVQRWLERNARSGTRYTEFLRSHFAVSPRDERLQRPEYIGGSKSPIIISEVLQTSQTSVDSPQGTMTGHGIAVNKGFAGTYNVTEHGLIMGIMSILPRTNYSQGINRQWLRKTPYDFFFPEFQNLSEQAVEQGEIYFNAGRAPSVPFGYQGRYNEMRYKPSMVSGLFKSTLNYWHLGRQFSTPPELNQDFVSTNDEDFTRIFEVGTEDYCLVSFGNIITAIRPICISSEPGLSDH